MIDEDVKARWVEALRSGEYQQGRRRLRTGGAYCCLGVLADLVAPNAWGKSGGYECWKGLVVTLPRELVPERIQEQATWLNDKGATFTEIADWIERGCPDEPQPAMGKAR